MRRLSSYSIDFVYVYVDVDAFIFIIIYMIYDILYKIND